MVVRLIAGVIVTTSLAFVGAPSVAEAAKRRGCSPRGAETIVANRKVRVFAVEFSPRAGEASYYACLRGRRARVSRLGEDVIGGGTGLFLGRFQLKGRIVAWAETACYMSAGCSFDVYSFHVGRARELRQYSGSNLVAMQLAETGSLAVIAQAPDQEGRRAGTPAVVKVEADGATVLDKGEDIDSRSLAIGGSWVYWTRGSQALAAPIQ
jgi:hypothetical protein